MDRPSTEINAEFFRQEFNLGNLLIPNRVLLSPLAGVSDVPFRRICQEQGAGLSYVEMLSAVAVKHASKRTFDMAVRHESEDRLGVQITGSTSDDVRDAAEILMQKPDYNTLDINMGCPVRKIVKKGAGSGILLDPERVTSTIEKCISVTDKPVSAKIRIGFTSDAINVEEISQRVAEAGAAMLTIHGRTRDNSYGDAVQYDAIKRGFDTAERATGTRPVFMGNGNVMDYRSAIHMVEETHCDAVLISRGALGNPWIFDQILKGHEQHPTMEQWAELVFRHLDYHQAHYGDEKLSVVMFRKHLLWYVKGFHSSRRLRVELSTENSFTEVRKILERFAKSIPDDIVRYQDAQFIEKVHADDYEPKYEMDRAHDRGVGDDE